jgi:hypothetical protein
MAMFAACCAAVLTFADGMVGFELHAAAKDANSTTPSTFRINWADWDIIRLDFPLHRTTSLPSATDIAYELDRKSKLLTDRRFCHLRGLQCAGD